MKTIYISKDLGVDFGNIPQEVLNHAYNMNSTTECGITFQLPDENIHSDIRTIRDFILRTSRVNTEVNEHREDFVITQLATPNVENNVNEEDDGYVLPAQIAQEIRETQQEDEVPDVQINGCIAAPAIPNILKIDGNERQMMAILMENETTMDAKNLTTKIREFNKKWTEVLATKREIETITRGIDSDPLISLITEDVTNLRRENNEVDDIFFVDGFVVLRTKELVTDNVIDGSRRIIGRMQISVNLKPMIGNSTSVTEPIIIKNIDRVFKRGSGSVFHCGHVNGNDVCWGNAHEQLILAFQSKSLQSIVEVAIRFIKNPNPADMWGSHMKEWPAAISNSPTQENNAT